MRQPSKALTRTLLAITECALEDGGRAAHFGNPAEKSAIRKLAAAGYVQITQLSRDELYAKLTADGIARLAELRQP